jgi:hypothetical protein
MSSPIEGPGPHISEIPRTLSVSLPTEESEEHMAIRRSEWHRIRQCVERLGESGSGWRTCASFAGGIAATAAFAIVASVASDKETQPPRWALTCYIVALALFAGVATVGVIAHRDIKGRRQESVTDICNDMDAIEHAHPSR